MPEYLAPGVYVEEVNSGPPPIQGVGTSTTGFVGVTRRGPTAGRPQLVTNYGEFVRLYGGPFDFGAPFAGHSDLPYAARGFFANGGRRLYVQRVVPATATVATETLRGGLVTRLVRDVPATTAVLALPTLRGLSTGSAVSLRMTKNGLTTSAGPFAITGLNRGTGEVTLGANVSATTTFEARYTTVFTNVGALAAVGSVTNLATPLTAKPATLGLQAANAGSWARDLQVSASHRSVATSVVDHAALAPGNTLILRTTRGFYVNAWVEIDFGDTAVHRLYRKVTAIAGTTIDVDGPAFAAGALNPVGVPETRISTCEFDLAMLYEDPVERTRTEERYTGLTLENVPGRHYATEMASSSLATVDPAIAVADTHPFLFPSPADGFFDTLTTGGNDGAAAPTATDFGGADLGPNQRTGLLSVEDVDEVAILAAPGVGVIDVQRMVIDQCERLMDRFAVLDPPGTLTTPATLAEIQTHASNFDTKYAAIYYPKVVVSDPITGARRVVAPSGHMCGIYARVDNTRGVHKAPANEVINGIVDIEVFVSKGQQEILNPRGINVLRDMRADRRGLRVYGARCLTSEQPWRYINVRRLFIFLEESLDEGTQWAVFEPNDHRLWARIRDSVSIFLTGAWKDGALMGEKVEESFFVVCDRNTMSDDDILNGRLVMEIGIAPVFPAEFVILRIGQWIGGSATQEL